MDRRRQERYEIAVPIKIKCEDGGSSATFDACSRDISSNGVFINAPDINIKARQKVHLEFTLTIEKLKELFGGSSMVTLEVNGVVVRSLENGLVIEFEDAYSISPKQKDLAIG